MFYKKCSFGFSLIEVLVALTILSIISLGVVSMLENTTRVMKTTSTVTSFRSSMEIYQGALESTSGWRRTVSDVGNNPNLYCLNDWSEYQNPPEPAPGRRYCNYSLDSASSQAPPTSFVNRIYDAAGNQVIYDKDGTGGVANGMTFSGLPCSTVSTSPNDCPISLRFWVSHYCSNLDPECTLPGVKIESVQSIRSGVDRAPAVNLENYKLRIVKRNLDSYVVPQSCAFGQVLNGYTNSGVPVCLTPRWDCRRVVGGQQVVWNAVPVSSPSCGQGYFATGGGAICGALTVIKDSYPSEDGRTWISSCGAAAFVSITPYAMCCKVEL